MADTYGVTPADIAAELPGLFPGGFAMSTKPDYTQVITFITSVDLGVTVAVQNASGAVPVATDRLAPLLRRVIIDRVKAMVLRIVYAALSPQDIATAAKPYEDLAAANLKAITDLQTQSAGAGETSSRVVFGPSIPTRDLLVTDADLAPAPHGRRFADQGRF